MSLKVYLDGATRYVEHVLSLNEDIVPEAGLLVALHLWKVKVGPCTTLLLLCHGFFGTSSPRQATKKQIQQTQKHMGSLAWQYWHDVLQDMF